MLVRDEKQFQGGLVFKAHRPFVSLNSRPRVIKKKRRRLRVTTRTAKMTLYPQPCGGICAYSGLLSLPYNTVKPTLRVL